MDAYAAILCVPKTLSELIKSTAPASPWQNGLAERLIGSIRRECLDHIIVPGEAHLRRTSISYAAYYNFVRTHRRCTRMRRFFVQFNRSESFVHTRSWAGFTIITFGFEFSVHTARSLRPRREASDKWLIKCGQRAAPVVVSEGLAAGAGVWFSVVDPGVPLGPGFLATCLVFHGPHVRIATARISTTAITANLRRKLIELSRS
jgi:hypothetical protein